MDSFKLSVVYLTFIVSIVHSLSTINTIIYFKGLNNSFTFTRFYSSQFFIYTLCIDPNVVNWFSSLFSNHKFKIHTLAFMSCFGIACN